jgi:hypothetical protein
LKGAARFPDLDGLLKDDGSIALDMENRQIESALRSGRPTDEDRDLEDKPSLGRPLGIGRVLFPRYRSAANQRDSDSS